MSDYTSSDEFFLENRVQITNEVPISRDYEAMHHSLRNDTWKWLIGTEDVEYDLPYGGSTTQDAPVKIVNGVQASTYGDVPYQKWNPDTEEYETVNPTGTRMEIKGVLSSEHDLFLHEIYRYLNCLYPDNPDWTKLLTRNEIIDAFNSAAAIVDYKPNNEFFEKVADMLTSDDPEIEEFKLNLRNLTSNAARRKFYGSLLGYRMYGQDIYENTIVFPVDKVLTLDPIDNYTSGLDPKTYKIDNFDERYSTLFRRIDWLGDNRDTSFVQSNGYVFSSYILPAYEDIAFEFVSSKDGDYTASDYQLYNDSSYSFYKKIGSDTTGSISDIVSFNVLEPTLYEDENTTSLSMISSDDKLYGLIMSEDSDISYSTLYKIVPYDEIVNIIHSNNLTPGFISSYIISTAPFKEDGTASDTPTNTWLYNFLYNLEPYIEDIGGWSKLMSKVDYIYNPFIKGTIKLPLDEMLKIYQDSVAFNKDETPIAISVEPDISELSLNKGDVISFENYETNPGFAYQVTGASYGIIDIDMNTDQNVSDYNSIKSYAPFNVNDNTYQSDDNYGIIITTTNSEKILLEGSLQFTWEYYTNAGATAIVPKTARFFIRAIPEKLTDAQYRFIYGTDYYTLIEEINENISTATKNIAKQRALVVQDMGNEDDITIYETYPDKITELRSDIANINSSLSSADENEIAELTETLNNKNKLLTSYQEALEEATQRLNDQSYSNFNNYKSAVEELNDYKSELSDAEAEHQLELANKSRILNNDISTIRRNCKVEFVGIGSTSIANIGCILDTGAISQISFGNISVEPILPTNSSPATYIINERTVQFANVNPTLIRDEQYHQLYSQIDSYDLPYVFKANSSVSIFNEDEFDVSTQIYINKSGTESVYEIQFLSDDAKTKFDSLTVGTSVSGPGLSSGTYITALSNYTATVNKALPKGGHFTFTFKCPVTTSPKSILDDPFNYKKIMYNRGEYDKVSFFDKGLYGTSEWPSATKAVINGNLKSKQILNTTTFFDVVRNLYSSKLTSDTQTLIPSIDKTTRNLFIDINISHLIKNIYNKSGSTDTLMNVDWLDYFTNYYNELFLAKDNVNVGANLTLETDTSGFASLLSDASYTDPNLKILFQTNNWTDTTVPAYVQLGNGGNNMKSYFKLSSTVYYPNVYGATFYDRTSKQILNDDNSTYVDDITDGNENVDVRKRQTYASTSELQNSSDTFTNYKNIDNPIFELPLNEYNINLRTVQNGRSYTTIDIMFYEHEFKNISKETSLIVTDKNSLNSNLINNISFTYVNSLDVTRSSNVNYYYFSDGNDEYSKGTLKIAIGTADEWTDYTILCGGCIGSIPYYVYYVNGTTAYRVFGPIWNEEGTVPVLGTDITTLLAAKTIIAQDETLYSDVLADYQNEFTLDDFVNKYEKFFSNKLVLFTYFSGWSKFDDSNICSSLKDFDLVGLIYLNGKLQVVNINKNYILCTTDIIERPNNISLPEYNLFYGYNAYNLITKQQYDAAINGSGLSFTDLIKADNEWIDLSNSIINYTNKVYNIISLPRKFIADGSYNIDLFLDPQFTAYGYDYDSFIKGEENKVYYYISQSPIKYDSENNLFYTYAKTIDDNCNSSDDNSKIVINFEENKYFKNLKYLYGQYDVRLSQKSGSSEEIKTAYISGIEGIDFDSSDLSTTDKFIYAEEINLRSPYKESLNNVLFVSTHDFEGEIFGITDDGDLLVSGKRNAYSRRAYDNNLISDISDITPATITDNELTKIESTDIVFSDLSLDNPRFTSFDVKQKLTSSYSTETPPQFAFYKNLLIFEGLVNLVSPNIIEIPNNDKGQFALVLDVLSSGDTIVNATALSGGSETTHTIFTDLNQRAKALSVNSGKLMVVAADNTMYSASNVSFESVTNLTLTKEDLKIDDDGTLIDIMYDSNLDVWVANIGLETDKGIDFYGDNYYTYTKSIVLDENGNSAAYASQFTSVGNLLTFNKKSNDNLIYIPKGTTYSITENDETVLINPNDIAISSYSEEEGTEDNYTAKDTNNNYILQHITEGPYIVDVDEYTDASSKMYQKIFTDDDVDIVLQQDYMFVKTYDYIVDEDGNYTSELTSEKHWKCAKMPKELDYTMMHLKSKTVGDAYNDVKDNIENFISWAKDDIQETSDGTGYIFTGTSVNSEPQSKEDIDEYIKALNILKDNLLTYDEFCKKAMFHNNDADLSVTYDNYGVSETPVTMITIDTKLPLNSSLKIDSSKNYRLTMSTDNGLITESSEGANFALFEDTYYQYLYDALVYVRGSKEYDVAGAKLVKDIYSLNGKLYFRLITGDLLKINKESLYKASDIEDSDNWSVSIMPEQSYMRLWKTEDLSKIGEFDLVELANGSTIAVNNREYNAYFFKITSDLFVCPDGQHMFFGGYSIPLSTIKSKYAESNNGEQLDITQEWIQNLLSSWVNDDTSLTSSKQGKKKPFVMYSNDGGQTFEALPVKGYIDDDIFTDGDDYSVDYFKYDTNYDKVVGFVKQNGENYTSRQVIIDFDYFGNVDTEATQYTQLTVPVDGDIKTLTVDGGYITWTTGNLGYGVDVDSNKARGSDTFNIDFTGNNAIIIPENLKVSSIVDNSAIRLNKPITERSSNGKYRVLIAVNTTADITNQASYLSNDTDVLKDYVTDDGIFRVQTQISVSNSSNANFIYMSRYFVYDTNVGYPTVEEDTNHIYYEYDTDTNNVVPLTNDYDNEIKICSETCDNILSVDGSFVMPNNLILNDVSLDSLQSAGKYLFSIKELETTTDAMEEDSDLTSLIKNNSNVIIKSINEDGLTATLSCNSSLSEMLQNYGIDENEEESTTVKENLESFIDEYEDVAIATEEDAATERFIYKNGYLYDTRFNVYVFHNQKFIKGELFIPYTFYNNGDGALSIPNADIEYDDSGFLSSLGSNATGIYYNPAGYGGLRNNDSLENETPWDRDPIAFEDSLLKNEYDEYVYITDENGAKQKMYNSIQYTDEINIDYDSFLNDGDNSATYDDTTLNFYKLTKTDIRQINSTSKINQNSSVIIRFFKNTERITNIELADEYVYDKSGHKVFACTFNNNVLKIGDKQIEEYDNGDLTVTFNVSYGPEDSFFTEVVTSTFELDTDNLPKIILTEDDEPSLIFVSTNKGNKYEINHTDVGQAEFDYVYELDDDYNVEDFGYYCDDATKSEVIINVNDNKLTINITTSTTVYNKIVITYNGHDFIKLPILNIEDPYIVDAVGQYYLGDMKIDNFKMEDEAVKINKIIMTLDYSLSKSFEKDTLVYGLYGDCISKKPKYASFQDLIYEEGLIVNSQTTYSESDLSDVNISSIEEDNSEFKLSNEISNVDSSKERYFLFKILTVSSQKLDVETMNNSDYYYELDIDDINTYPPDRVWFNPNGSPLPPITVNGKIFNSENNYAYYDDIYRNGLSLPIYLCDKDGHYINYDNNGNSYRLDPNEDGDCSKYIYTGVDGRYTSPKPINSSCKEWYKNTIWSSKKDVNPLWQLIHISPKIKNKKWIQNVSLCRYEKSGNYQVLTSDIDYSYVELNELNSISTDNQYIQFMNDNNTFNMKTGEVDLLLTKSNDDYFSNETLTKYGLNFYTNEFTSRSSLKATIQASYTVNTKRDFTSKKQDDAAIATITEMGIFNKNHNLIAYAQFPPIEYRTDSQHIDFTAVIYHGNMTSAE